MLVPMTTTESNLGPKGIEPHGVNVPTTKCEYTEGILACTQNATRAFKAESCQIPGRQSPLDYVTAHVYVCTHHDSTGIVTSILEASLAPWFPKEIDLT